MMFKKLGLIAILVVLALVSAVPVVSAQVGLPTGRGQGPPSPPPRGQALVTGSIWVQKTGIYEGVQFPPPYEPIEDGPISRFVFNARKGDQLVLHPAFPPEWGVYVWEATGHLFWFVDGEVIRVNIEYMLVDGEGWWNIPELVDPQPRCNYISGSIGDDSGMCFVVCDGYPDIPGSKPFVYVASINMGDMYYFDVLRGSVIIRP